MVYSLPTYEKFNKIEWGFHNARINCVAWSPDSLMVASGSLDTMIIIWNMTQPNKHIIIKSKTYLFIILTKEASGCVEKVESVKADFCCKDF